MGWSWRNLLDSEEVVEEARRWAVVMGLGTARLIVRVQKLISEELEAGVKAVEELELPRRGEGAFEEVWVRQVGAEAGEELEIRCCCLTIRVGGSLSHRHARSLRCSCASVMVRVDLCFLSGHAVKLLRLETRYLSPSLDRPVYVLDAHVRILLRAPLPLQAAAQVL